MKNYPFDWYTTPAFVGLTPLNVFRKEQEKSDIKSEIQNYHCLARSHWNYDGGRAVMLISADDCFKLFINGRFICYGPAPSYFDDCFYNEIDIAPYLKKGDNIIAVHLYYQGLINRVWQSGDNRFGTGASINGVSLKWKYKECNAFSGEVLGYDTAFSENFDSRLFDESWNTPTYNDSDWSDMVKIKSDHIFRPQPTKPLEYYSVKGIKENNRYDFKSETAGVIKITAKGKSGDRVTIRLGEELNADSSVRYKLRANCVYEEIWILGDGVCSYEGYDYKGFRYAEIICSDESVEIISVETVACRYPFDGEMCELKSNDKNLEAVFNLCKNTIKVGCQNSYIDCPTREKGQYLGDALIIANSHILLTKDNSLLRKAVDDFAKTSKICKGLTAVSSCSLMQEIADYSLLFGELLLLDYKYSNDKLFLQKYYETAKNVIKYFQKYEDKNGLLNQVGEKWNLVDWPENCRDNYDFPLTRPVVGKGVHNVINAYYIGAIKTLNKIEDILGIQKSFDSEKKQKEYVNAFLKNGLFTDSKASEHSSLHSNVFALYFDLVPPENKQTVINFIITKGFSCGVYTSYFLLKALCENKRFEESYRLIVNDGENGWLNMLREGATTCFEVWGKEQKRNTSLCHPWATAPITVIVEYLAKADILNLEIKLTSHGGNYALSDNE